jgi:hypothetical protein
MLFLVQVSMQMHTRGEKSPTAPRSGATGRWTGWAHSFSQTIPLPGGPARGQRGGNRCSHFLIQVSEYLANHLRVFDAGNNPDLTAAFTTGIKVNIKHSF